MRAEGTAGSGKGGISECLGQRTSVRNWNCLYRYIIKMVQLHFCLLLSYVFALSPFGSFKRGAQTLPSPMRFVSNYFIIL